jgi:hypothetical protein
MVGQREEERGGGARKVNKEENKIKENGKVKTDTSALTCIDFAGHNNLVMQS